MSFKLDPRRFDRDLLTELLEAKILVFFSDPEAKTEYLGVRPTVRRELLQLPPPLCGTLEEFQQRLNSQKELTKMDEIRPIVGLETAPEVGHHAPPAERLVTDIEEGETYE